MEMHEESVVELKFEPKAHVKCKKKCFDIVDKCCMKIMKKFEFSNNWNKIIEREICLAKIRYPFLSDKQIKGKALQKLGIPNLMGDIIRFGAHKVTGNLGKGLNLLTVKTVKKESRDPPAFKYIKKTHVETIKKEMKPEGSAVSHSQNSSKRQNSFAPRVEKSLYELSKANSKESNASDTLQSVPDKILEFTPKFFRKRPLQSNESDSENDVPSKARKMAWADLDEDNSSCKSYFTPSSRNSSINDNEDIDGKEKSDVSAGWRLNRIASQSDKDSDKKSDFLAPHNFSFSQSSGSSENRMKQGLVSPAIFSQTQSEEFDEIKILHKTLSWTSNEKNLRKSMLTVERNSQDLRQDDHDVSSWNRGNVLKTSPIESPQIIQDELNTSYYQGQSDGSMNHQRILSQKDFLINPFGKENRRSPFCYNHTTPPVFQSQFQFTGNFKNNWRTLAHNRPILEEFHQTPNVPAFNYLRSASPFFPGAIKNRGSTGIYESAYVINSSVRTQNTDPGLQVLKMLKTNLLADQVRLVHDFRSISPPEEINSQNVDSTSPQPIVSQEYDEKISEPEFIFISDNEKEQILPDMEDTLSSGENLAIEKNGSLDNETASDSQVILISNDEEVQFVSQQIISQNVREIFTFEENISSAENSLLREEVNVKQQSFSFPKSESSIETINSLTLPSASSTHEFTGEEYEGSSLEIDSLSTRNFKCHENSRCPENMSYKKVNSRKSNASLNYRVMSSDVDTISSPIPGRKISNPEDVQSLEDVNFYDEPACQVSQPISSTVDEYFSAENCTDTTENLRCTYSEIATQSTSYATSTDNSNPWLSVTSKDFSQGDCFDNASARSQDSGQASKDSLISLRSFISTISKEETDDDEEETSHDRFLSIRQMLKMKASAIQKEIKRIILWLENEI